MKLYVDTHYMLYFNTILCNNRFIRQWNILLPYPPCEISPVRSQVFDKSPVFSHLVQLFYKNIFCVLNYSI